MMTLSAAEKVPEEMQAEGGQTSSESLSFPVEAGRDYVLRVRIRSDGIFAVTVGSLTMSYNRPGEWQTLAGLIRTGTAQEIKVVFELRGEEGSGASCQLEGFRLDPFGAIPQVEVRQLSGKTLLHSNSQTGAVIVYPAGDAKHQLLAEKVCQALEKSGGIVLPVQTDEEVMELEKPQLRAAYLKRPLIVLGRLTNNRAFWPAYLRFLDATDGYYPGGDGFVVRTAVGAGDGNTNHIILGGSSNGGVDRAVQEFCRLLEAQSAELRSDRGVQLPYLLKVVLGAECLLSFEENDKLWTNDPLNHLLPKVESGYGTVLRFYENAMAWYWSGQKSYRQRARDTLKTVLKEKAYTHQYPLEFFVRTVRMLEGTGFFEPGEFSEVVGLLASNFQDFSSLELNWMPRFSPPYDAITIANRHQIAPWMSDLANAAFLRRFYPPNTEFGAVVEFRYSEKRAFLDSVVRDRWGTSIPGVGPGGHEEEIIASLFRYAMDYEQFDFFTKGNARRAGEEFAAKIKPNTGTLVRPKDRPDHELITGIVACYYKDPKFASLRRHLLRTAASTSPFMRRYVNGVHRFTPGEEVPDGQSDEFDGVWSSGLMPHNFPLVRKMGSAPFLGTKLAHYDILDLLVIRSGVEPDSDHLTLSGVRHDALPNTLLSLSSAGVDWLLFPDSQRYYEQNAVDVQRLDEWPKTSRYGSAVRNNWTVDFGGSGGFSGTLNPFVDMAWTREILWIEEGLWIFKDDLRALEDGRFSAVVTWVSAFPLQQWEGSWKAVSGDAGFYITPLSLKWESYLDRETDSSWKTDSYFLREKQITNLQTDQCISAVTLLQVTKGESKPYRAEWKLPHVLELRSRRDAKDVKFVGWPGAVFPNIDIQAAATILDGQAFRVLQCRKLTVGGRTVFASPLPVDLVFDRENREIVGMGSPDSLPPNESEDIWSALGDLEASLRDSPGLSLVSAEATSAPITTNLQEAPWQETWSFPGFKRPVPVLTGSTRSGGVFDLGQTYPLAEISLRDRSNAQDGALPDSILVAAPVLVDGREEIPAFDSPDWKEVATEKFWRPSIETANYGQADPVVEGYEAVLLSGLPVRYVRTTNGARLTYYTNNPLRAGVPLKVQPIPARDGEAEQIFVHSDIWPEYRWLREENALAGVLNAAGEASFIYDVPVNLQAARLVDLEGNGKFSIGVLTSDAKLRLFDTEGRILNEWEFYSQHQKFDATYGKPNQRTPAGLYTQPASFGVWRRSSSGEPRWVIGRYCMMSFLDEAGTLEGVLRGGSYWNPGLLSEGADFSSDGMVETLAVSAGEILHIDGEDTPYVSEPGGDLYYPQVHHQQTVALPDIDGRRGLAGAPILAFQILNWGGQPRFVILVRENCLVIYDAKDRRFVYSWVPAVPLDASAVIRDDEDALVVLCASKDRQLWRLEWKTDISQLAEFSTVPLPDRLAQISCRPQLWPESSVLSGSEGLYLLDEKCDSHTIAKGSFHSAAFFPAQSRNRDSFYVVAATEDGDVIRYDRNPGNSPTPP